ncbi:hypothetical protein [Dyadobacter sp. OTU695]|uniref:hypothetical protein n=1 Tax=Dyadobacter sp. OTU695 TaxID=3043860 RepID=UPI00313CD8E2
MNEPFVIPVAYQGIKREFEARFERWGYTHRIAVLIDETTFSFEPNTECGYRAITENPAISPNVGLFPRSRGSLQT